jgi:hypothetical protein
MSYPEFSVATVAKEIGAQARFVTVSRWRASSFRRRPESRNFYASDKYRMCDPPILRAPNSLTRARSGRTTSVIGTVSGWF